MMLGSFSAKPSSWERFQLPLWLFLSPRNGYARPQQVVTSRSQLTTAQLAGPIYIGPAGSGSRGHVYFSAGFANFRPQDALVSLVFSKDSGIAQQAKSIVDDIKTVLVDLFC